MRILRGYHKPINALAVSPDGARLFSAAQGHTQIWQWNLADGAVERKLRGAHAEEVRALACTTDGRLLVSAEPYLGLVVWSLSDGKPRVLPRRPGDKTISARDLSLHPNSSLAATSLWEDRERERFGVVLWNLYGDGEPPALAWQTGCISAVAFSPSGELLATASADSTVRLWDHRQGVEVQRLIQKAAPYWLAFRLDGKTLAVGTEKVVCVWDLSRGERGEILTDQVQPIVGLNYSPDGKHLAVAARDGVVRLYDAATNALVGQRHLEIGKLTSLCWLPDSSGLAAGGEKLIAVCELAELLGEQAKPKARGEPLSLAGHEVPVEGLRYSPDGRALLSWGRRGQRMWDLSGGAGQAKPAAEFASRVCNHPGGASWSPDGKRVALFCGYSGYVIDSRSGALLHEFPTDQWGMRLTFTPAGRLFRAVWTRQQDPPARLDLLAGEGPAPLRSTGFVYRPHEMLATHFPRADDRHVYFTLHPGEVYRWQTQTGQVVRLFGQKTVITRLEVSDDEQRFLTTAGSTASVRRLGDKKALELRHPLACSGAAFLPGGRVLTGCYDDLVRVWDAEGGTELFAFDLGMGRVTCLAASPDFMTFAAGVEKGCRIVLMDVPE